MLCYYEKRRYENCRNQNSVQRYNKKINCTNISLLFGRNSCQLQDTATVPSKGSLSG